VRARVQGTLTRGEQQVAQRKFPSYLGHAQLTLQVMLPGAIASWRNEVGHLTLPCLGTTVHKQPICRVVHRYIHKAPTRGVNHIGPLEHLSETRGHEAHLLLPRHV